MAEKKFLSWLGFKEEAGSAPSHLSDELEEDARKGASAAPKSSTTFERIRELETELADLRSRRDITGLTQEEFEILATETAISLIKAAQAREARAVVAAQRSLSEAQRVAKQLTDSTESKARTVLQSAESRGRKYLESAQQEAKEAIDKATKLAQDLLDSKQREASTITSTAKREADRTISEATTDIANFKNWLRGAVEESERLQKIQHQTLAAAEEGIRTTRARLASTFEKLSALGSEIESAIDESHRPKAREFTRATPAAAEKEAKLVSNRARKTAAESVVKRPATRASVGKPPKRK